MLVGILPTLEKGHLALDNMTPESALLRLNQVMSELRGGRLPDADQGHRRAPDDARQRDARGLQHELPGALPGRSRRVRQLYNVAQVVTAPVLAAAVNSPVLLEHRLWHETRVALFQQSLDARSKRTRRAATASG